MKLAPPWLARYRRQQFGQDVLAGVVATVLLVPQSLAYAMLAGLPPQMGLYASILAPMLYACLGSSSVQAVGPVAITALMTASIVGPLAAAGTQEYVAIASVLALLSGAMLLAFGLLRLGFAANLLSAPVVAGFVSGSAVLIVLAQIKVLLGMQGQGHTAMALAESMLEHLGTINRVTATIGLVCLAALWLARRYLHVGMLRWGIAQQRAELFSRLAPVLVALGAGATVAWLGLDRTASVAVVGPIPGGLPHPGLPLPVSVGVGQLVVPALLMAIVGFVQSISIAQAMAMRRGERIDPNAELCGLGLAGIGAAVTAGGPVSGGMSRTVVNLAAGATSPVAGAVTGALFMVVLLGLANGFGPLPHAMLAASIVLGAASLIDIAALRRAWRYDRADAAAYLGTALGVLMLGIQAGIGIGITLALAVLVWRASRPHIAVVGRMPGTEHFRNVARHVVDTLPGLLALRIDENLFFANANVVDARLRDELAARPGTRDLLLVMSSVSQIDLTGLEMLLALNRDLAAQDVRLHLAEVKGPVLDRLQNTDLLDQISGRLFLSTHDAFVALQAHPHPASDD